MIHKKATWVRFPARISAAYSKLFRIDDIVFQFLIKHVHIFYNVVVNAPVPVTANMNINVAVDLKLQVRGHTGIFIFIKINLIHPIIYFLNIELKKVIVSYNIFKFNISFLLVLQI